ncbi:MAG: hypothetical protein PQJ59_03870 [Spirochaetales bacterium]|nr:hypothetical protein [Spirochaetales bacterium]
MTLSTRHKITYTLFTGSLILNGLLFYFLLNRFEGLTGVHPLSLVEQNWWFQDYIDGTTRLGQILLMHGIFTFTTLIGTLIIGLTFKRSSSQEIFYFQLFLLCLSLLTLRLGSYAVAWYSLPFSYSVLLSRTVLFFRFSALLFLLLSGLSVFDSRFQKSDPFFLAAVVISFCLAATVPMGGQFIGNTLSYLPTGELNLFFLFLIVKLIIPINFLWFVYQRKTVDYVMLTLACLLAIVAESLLFYMTFLSFFLGMSCLLIGGFLFSHRIYKLYLWR